MAVPNNYLTIINSSYYKIGVHEKVFMWCNTGWIKSSKTKDELLEAWTLDFKRLLKKTAESNKVKTARKIIALHAADVKAEEKAHLKKIEPLIQSGGWIKAPAIELIKTK